MRSTPPTRRPALLGLLLALLFCGCAAFGGSKPEWVTGQMPAASERVLWEVTRIALESQGFHVLTDGFDPQSRSTQSAWQLDLHPFRGEGFRERAHVSYEPIGPGRIELSVRVEHERNNNIAKPTSPEYAEWKKEADNAERAQVILQQIQARLAQPRGGTRPG